MKRDRPNSVLDHILTSQALIIVALFSMNLVLIEVATAQQLSHSPKLELSGEVFSHFSTIQTESQHFSSFDIERAELGLQSAQEDNWGGELRLESVRSAGEDSLMGIDGDSLVMRVKRAWGFGRFIGDHWSITGRFGLIPDVWHMRVMSAFPLRALGPSQGEREGLQDTSDLGTSLTLKFHSQSIFLSLTNGEGRLYQEQNKGKNLLIGTHLTTGIGTGNGHLSIAYRDGSRGPSSGQDHRLYLSSWWSSSQFSLGLIATQATGVKQRPSLSAYAAQAWIAGWIIPNYLGIFTVGEWIEYQNQTTPISSFEMIDPRPIQSLESTRSATRWLTGLNHRLYQFLPQTPQDSAINLILFESLEYQGASNLKSPVFGIPQLAEIWRFSMTLCLSWGPTPLQSIPANSQNLF